jgi:hypothetical protein
MELENTTLMETFERYGREGGDGEEGERYGEIDVEKNLLKNLLESHASQMGQAGPATTLLSQLGIPLPNPPQLHE